MRSNPYLGNCVISRYGSVDPRQDPSNYFTQPPLVTVEQAWAQPGIPVERIPEEGTGGAGIFTQIGWGIRRLFGQKIDQAISQTFYNNQGYPTYPQYVAQPEPMPAWVTPVVIGGVVLGAVVLLRRR